jgi:molybdopterin converting factor small subunit
MASGPDATSTDAEVTIRYWASARAAAGCDSEPFSGSSVGEVLQAAASAHAALGGVLAISTILLDGRPVGAGVRLSAGTTLEVLPPFAGG